MATVRYRSVHANLQTPDSPADKRSSIKTAWARADVLKFNDAGAASTGDSIRALPGVKMFRPGGVGDETTIAWRDSIFKKIDGDYAMTFQGRGHNGSFGIRGSRGVTWVVLEHRATGARVLEVEMYTIAAYSTYPTLWTEMVGKAADEIRRAMTLHPGIPVVIAGDMNRPSSVTFGLGEREVDLPGTHGPGNSKPIDKVFLINAVRSLSHDVFPTKSDHLAVRVTLELDDQPVQAPPAQPTTPVVTPTTPDPLVPVAGGTPPVAPPPSVTEVQRNAIATQPRWRYFAMRVTGDGVETVLHPDLPLADVQIEDVISGHSSLQGKLSPEMVSLIGPDRRPLLEEWGTSIWAEESGNIVGGGILVDSSFARGEWSLDCLDLTGYAADTPYAGSKFFVETDVLDIFRHIWAHLQAQPGGNLGMTIDTLKTGVLIGTELEQKEFDTQEGPVSFEAGPYKLAWYQDHNLDDNLSTLSADYGFDWHVRHWIDASGSLRHHMDLGYPHLGRRRTDLRFVIGENVHEIPTVDRDGNEYADEVWYLGAGEGSEMKRGIARRDIKRLRRVSVQVDPSLRSQSAVDKAANRDMAWRYNIDSLSELVIIEHPHAPLGALNTGDEILVQGDAGWLEVNAWYRVVSRRINPSGPGRQVLTIERADRLT